MTPRLIPCIACVLLAFIWLGPLPELARESFSAHMAMHVLVLCVCAPMLVVLVKDRWIRWPGAPLLATLLDFIIVWAWHTPFLHSTARHSGMGFILEQGSYIFAGLLVWSTALCDHSPPGRARGIASLLLTSMHMTFLGVLLAVAARPLYEHSQGSPFAYSTMQDQQLGGIIMLSVGGCVYLAGALYLLSRLLTIPLPGEDFHARDLQ